MTKKFLDGKFDGRLTKGAKLEHFDKYNNVCYSFRPRSFELFKRRKPLDIDHHVLALALTTESRKAGAGAGAPAHLGDRGLFIDNMCDHDNIFEYELM